MVRTVRCALQAPALRVTRWLGDQCAADIRILSYPGNAYPMFVFVCTPGLYTGFTRLHSILKQYKDRSGNVSATERMLATQAVNVKVCFTCLSRYILSMCWDFIVTRLYLSFYQHVRLSHIRNRTATSDACIMWDLRPKVALNSLL